MNTSQAAIHVKKPANTIEWKLLVFLLLFMDVKLWIKAIALVFIYFSQTDFRFGFRLTQSRLPLFYLIVVLIGALNFFLYPNFTTAYSAVALTGTLYWLACILAIHQLKLFTAQTDTAILHNTVAAFFIINIAFSIFNLATIFFEIGIRNPFHYQGEFQKYFINTGDHIKGVTFDISTSNALINCFGAVYFLHRKKFLLVLLCMATLLLTGSNFSNIILLIVFAGMFFWKTDRAQKSVIITCCMLFIIFMVKLSPQNDIYVNETLKNFVLKNKGHKAVEPAVIPIRERPDSILDQNSRKEKIATLFLDSLERQRIAKTPLFKSIPDATQKPAIPGDSIHTATFQWKRDTTADQSKLIAFMRSRLGNEPMRFDSASPGKIQAFKQSFDFFKRHPARLFTGSGTGNFSSKLAFRATGLNIAGGFPGSLVFCSPLFLNGHLSLYNYFFTERRFAFYYT